ncbi:MAG: hypothetical protein ACI9CO_000010 [Candidatus Azotimanducaceae bacterium]|jgi:hypothetical protein
MKLKKGTDLFIKGDGFICNVLQSQFYFCYAPILVMTRKQSLVSISGPNRNSVVKAIYTRN